MTGPTSLCGLATARYVSGGISESAKAADSIEPSLAGVDGLRATSASSDKGAIDVLGC